MSAFLRISSASPLAADVPRTWRRPLLLTQSGPRASRGLDLEKHPDKTFIGRIERGFDFLGYHFSPEGLTVAEKTIEQFVERALRLYEQEPGELGGSSRLGMYVRRWVGWAEAGFAKGQIPSSKFRPEPTPSLASSPAVATTDVTTGQL